VEALALACNQCGAAVDPAVDRCPYCNVRLATMACPRCMGMLFVGSKHCPHCGERAIAPAPASTASDKPRPCPRCRTSLQPTAFGALLVDACERCGGLWLDAAAFEKVCHDKEIDGAIFGAGSPLIAGGGKAVGEAARPGTFYGKCPVCTTIMNRVNFVGCSGVLVDVCKGHGTWFDRDELRQVIEFLRAGGMEKALDRRHAQLEEARQRAVAAARAIVAEGRALEADERSVFGDLVDLLFR
jgi:Zn-finger nucleic acid-binding protein